MSGGAANATAAAATASNKPGVRGGRPRIDGHGITVERISYWHEHEGKCVEEIAYTFNLTLAQVHAALAYYFDHRDEIEAERQATAARIAAMKAETSAPLAETTV